MPILRKMKEKIKGDKKMAKDGMRRYQPGDIHGGRKPKHHSHKNDVEPVPELQGKAKSGKEKATPK